jgi:hypothetical protein
MSLTLSGILDPPPFGFKSHPPHLNLRLNLGYLRKKDPIYNGVWGLKIEHKFTGKKFRYVSL